MITKMTRLFVVCALTSIYAGLQANAIIIASVDEYTKHVQGPKPVLAMFTASWCGPCKQTKPYFLELAQAYPDITFCVVDIDNKGLSSITKGIKGVPTFIANHKGQEVIHKAGGMTRTQLQDMIETFKAEVTGQPKAAVQKAPELTADDCYARGLAHYKKIIEICQKKDFDIAGLEAALFDEASAEIFKDFSIDDPSSASNKKPFENYKNYSRGAKKALEGYKFQSINPQDSIIRYSMHSFDMVLASPDYATYLSRQMKIAELIQKRMKLLTYEILADIDFSSL